MTASPIQLVGGASGARGINRGAQLGGLNGLVTKSSAPALMPSSRSPVRSAP
jgi:hypothetical protein